ncbi:MAG: hypothetical protein KA166_06040 [Saprospiraceae bacterium]|nr:hypothetical protein [Saprospiraceae bacterium]
MKPTSLSPLGIRLFILLTFLVSFGSMTAQNTVAPTMMDTSKMTYNQISQTMKLYVFPAKGQSQSQQKKDEYECYNWAVGQSGIDPLHPPKVEAAPVQSGPTGAAVGGAAKGAAAGAAIGAITGDAGEGAAVGAIVGGIAGRRQGQAAQANANATAQKNTAAEEQAMKDSFTKAFSACLEGKGYTIK